MDLLPFKLCAHLVNNKARGARECYALVLWEMAFTFLTDRVLMSMVIK